MNSSRPLRSKRRDHLTGQRAGVVGSVAAAAAAVVIALVVAGFILAGYLDASGATSIPAVGWLVRLPRSIRLIVEILVGVPLAFGAALYVFTQLIELAWLVLWPVRKAIHAVAGRFSA